MNVAILKLKSVATCFALLFLLTASSASANSTIQITSFSAPSSIDNPLMGFSVNLTLTGSQQCGTLGSGFAWINFYLSDTPDGTGQTYLMATQTVTLRKGGSGFFDPCYAPSGTVTVNVSQADVNMHQGAVARLENIVTSCGGPQRWYILAQVQGTGSRASASSSIGGWRAPDQFFTEAALSPSVIQPGGTTELSFKLYRQCPTWNYPSTLRILLLNANGWPLSTIATVSIPGESGVTTLYPSGITVSASPGTYYIVVQADANNAVPEADESNNAAGFMLKIAYGAQPSLGHDEARLETEVRLLGDPASLVHGLEPGASDAYLHER